MHHNLDWLALGVVHGAVVLQLLLTQWCAVTSQEAIYMIQSWNDSFCVHIVGGLR